MCPRGGCRQEPRFAAGKIETFAGIKIKCWRAPWCRVQVSFDLVHLTVSSTHAPHISSTHAPKCPNHAFPPSLLQSFFHARCPPPAARRPGCVPSQSRSDRPEQHDELDNGSIFSPPGLVFARLGLRFCKTAMELCRRRRSPKRPRGETTTTIGRRWRGSAYFRG